MNKIWNSGQRPRPWFYHLFYPHFAYSGFVFGWDGLWNFGDGFPGVATSMEASLGLPQSVQLHDFDL